MHSLSPVDSSFLATPLLLLKLNLILEFFSFNIEQLQFALLTFCFKITMM